MTKTAEEALAAALTEWDRRWQEEPDRFLSEADALAQDPEDYGSAAAPYLLSILEELGFSRVIVGTGLREGPTSREILEGQARRDRELDEADPLEVPGEIS